MPSAIDNNQNPILTAETFALCLLLASSLQIMENLLPRIPLFPWLRLGLAYLVILPFLLRFGAIKACGLLICRNLITLIYGGQIFSSFMVSTLSGVVSIGIVGQVVFRLSKLNLLGVMGGSVILAVGFNSMQLVVVGQFFVHHMDFYFQVAPLLVWSLVSGTLIAYLVVRNQSGFEFLVRPQDREFVITRQSGQQTRNWQDSGLLVIAGMTMIGLFFLPSFIYQLVTLLILLLLTRWRNLRLIIYAWPFYFYIAFFHLFRTDGVFLIGEWITREGLYSFLYYALRTTNVIICGQWITRYIPFIWTTPSSNPYLRGMSYALPVLPSLFGISMSLGKTLLGQIRHKQFNNLFALIFEQLEKELALLNRQNQFL